MATTTLEQAYRVAAGEGLADLWWKTGRLTVKASGAETGGAFSQIEVDDPQGCAPPMHIHHGEEETFYVVDGEVTVFADGARIDLSAGDYAFVPRGVDHAYIVRSERARMLVTFSPSGFEQFFVQEGIPVEDGETDEPVGGVQPSPEEFIRRLAPYGCEVTGPPPALADL
jgi:quercetin dioxygenase-like cupin family protein